MPTVLNNMPSIQPKTAINSRRSSSESYAVEFIWHVNIIGRAQNGKSCFTFTSTNVVRSSIQCVRVGMLIVVCFFHMCAIPMAAAIKS